MTAEETGNHSWFAHANKQGTTLEETRENLKEAVEFVLEANRQFARESENGAKIIREPLALAE
ncbi:MAG: type II toxin-antitoxin system HicB family antitoxin [Pyrinomonadaceae bacterium]